jgi:phosphomannomutase
MQVKTKASSSPYNFNPVILREYDIRGIVGESLSEADAYALGLSFGTLLSKQNGKHVMVGYDGRTTSPTLSKSLIKGLTETGMNVENIGLGPTPMLYFSVKDRKADAGIMITGSHNPAEYNGFKIMLQSGPFYGDMIQDIGRIAASGDFASGKGSIKDIDIKDSYVERLLKDYNGTRDLHVAWDSGNGAAGEILRRLVKKLPGQHELLFDEIDGNFPNHHPDPTVDKNLVDLQKLVAEKKCDLGIAFDGDGDRIGAVDSEGNIIRGDILLTIYAREVLKEHPGAPIIGDIKCSQVMFDEIKRMGGTPIMWKTGHSLVKAKMAELKSPLAGELSGHIFFADKYYGFDDALYCGVRLMNAVSAVNGDFTQLTGSLPDMQSTPELRIEVDESEKFALVAKLIENVRRNHKDVETIDIDGIRVSTNDGWWLLRASNTQNVLVARAEGKTPEGFERLKSMLAKEVENIGYTINFV